MCCFPFQVEDVVGRKGEAYERVTTKRQTGRVEERGEYKGDAGRPKREHKRLAEQGVFKIEPASQYMNLGSEIKVRRVEPGGMQAVKAKDERSALKLVF